MSSSLALLAISLYESITAFLRVFKACKSLDVSNILPFNLPSCILNVCLG
nr:MAG TPA: hypothetical protein [Caudoviricetes sp.]